MKKTILPAALLLLLSACGGGQTPKEEAKLAILNADMPYCESVLFHDGRMFVPSFGAVSEFNSLNTEKKGYILEFTGDDAKILFPNDGNLSAPKGTIVKGNRLFVADVNQMAVYNLANPAEAAQMIVFPEGELMLNDFALKDNLLYVTVTNTGNIYTLDVTDPGRIDPASLQFYTNVPGCNGILIDGKTMYVASFPPDMTVTDANVIYRIEDMDNPALTKLISRGGMYDGLQLSPDGTKLYYSDWGVTGDKGEVGYIDLATGALQPLELRTELAGPGRIWLHEGKLYIPDMPNSRIVVYTL